MSTGRIWKYLSSLWVAPLLALTGWAAVIPSSDRNLAAHCPALFVRHRKIIAGMGAFVNRPEEFRVMPLFTKKTIESRAFSRGDKGDRAPGREIDFEPPF